VIVPVAAILAVVRVMVAVMFVVLFVTGMVVMMIMSVVMFVTGMVVMVAEMRAAFRRVTADRLDHPLDVGREPLETG